MIINDIRKKKFIKKIISFIYYLRYLIFIFIFAIILLFTAPKLFNFVDKIDDLNDVLKNRHGFTIKNQGHIEYKIFPQPNLEIKDTNISIDKQFSNISFKELKIYTNLKSLYFSEEI